MKPGAETEPVFAAIGIPCESGELTLSGRAAEIVRKSRVFSGGKRHFEKVRDLLPAGGEWIDIGGDIEKTLKEYDRRRGNGTIVIFASGDPLFYGIGSTLRRLRPECELEIFRAPSSVETLCRRAGVEADGIAGASVHGRDWHELDRALIGGEKLTGLLTDSVNSPDAAAERMVFYGFADYKCLCGERLGEKDERIRSFSSAREMARTEFSQPCAVVLEKTSEAGGEKNAESAEFETLRGKPGMITKPGARRMAIERLELDRAEHFWDIGFCTGSVSVEARRRFPALRVAAFEKNRDCEEVIEKNAKRFSAPGIKVVMGDFFESGAEKLPAPDAVFIGGHGGRLEDMISTLGKTVRRGGRVVINSVTEESGKIFREKSGGAGFEFTGEKKADNVEILSAVKK
ncbi:MAG: precorrin-6y C5,15-methyltransferase (decarboxylating) subunit CbiE [Thermodesulfobacteriota bacterium]